MWCDLPTNLTLLVSFRRSKDDLDIHMSLPQNAVQTPGHYITLPVLGKHGTSPGFGIHCKGT
jgi:hypothetical protein